ncbi:hypothetical protein FCH28_09125 [Streptomyces piniterrae]|uniref:DUF8094 domain-containing protein n=1 Tax=Streptomyces piniterrae TaxID=2571125 RepID=A0A4U0NMC7_9ACTN|nr:hypothetical protein [Streptomyces piniterrae]TJZ55507.1 hypothetical protein FCH28_09125 [Streptomyces piniterrae]
MTVHGEKEMLPAVSKADGVKALQNFAERYTEANRKLDPNLNAAYEAGALHEIDQAGLKAQRGVRPQGYPDFRPLKFRDEHIAVPKQAGWPKYFLADALTNRTDAKGNAIRWFLVFSRDSVDAKWRAVHFATFAGNKAPELKTDADGFAEAVPADGKSGLTVDPGKLGKTYADFLNTGKGDDFASGRFTDGLRANRVKNSHPIGAQLQWEDQPASYPPVSLRTKDGGALVFTSTVSHMQKTWYKGAKITVAPELRGIVEGSWKGSNRMAFTWVSGQTVKVPAKDAGGKIEILNRIERITSAKAQ